MVDEKAVEVRSGDKGSCAKRGVYAVGGDNSGEKEIEAVDEEEQVVCPPCLPDVYQPTQSEYLDHCVTHFPYRAWCRHCVEGRGREFGHEKHRGVKDERASPVISFDYCFIGDDEDVSDIEGFEAAGEKAAKVLVVRDSKSKAVFAHVVPSKGADEAGFAVSALTGDVKWLLDTADLPSRATMSRL